MNIQVITTYYREEFLVPLFMQHYEGWVDKITVITEKFPGGRFDDQCKIDWINKAVDFSDSDWVIVVDLDEFVFPIPLGTDPRNLLEKTSSDIFNCEMCRVWRHRTESDVDFSKPPLLQRRHGNGVHDHTKPCIFRPGNILVGIGAHTVKCERNSTLKYGDQWGAVHWANADPCFGIQRTLRDRQERLSERNVQNGWGYMPQWKEPGHLKNLYDSHLDDPVVKFFQ